MKKQGLVAWVSILVGAGCSLDSRRLVVDVPADIDAVGLVFDDGRTLVGTGLAARDGDHFDQVAPALDDDARVHILGYRQSTLERFGVPNVTDIRAAPLRAVMPGEPLLPTPDFHVSGVSGRPADWSPGNRSLGLTADWIPCPLLPTASATVDMSCFGFWCDATVAQVGCQLSYAAPSCTSAGPVTADVDRLGDTRFAPHRDLTACAGSPLAGDGLVQCRGPGELNCQARIVGPRGRPSVAVAVFPMVTEREPTESPRWRGGYLHGLVANKHRLFAVGSGGRFANRGECPFRRADVYILDTRTASVTMLRIPECIWTIAEDPTGHGFLAIVGNDTLSFARFAADGRMTARREVGPVQLAAVVASLVASSSADSAAFLLRVVAGPTAGARVFVTDLTTLSQVIRVDRVFATGTEVIGFMPDGRLVVPDNSAVLWRIDSRTGAVLSGPSIDDCALSEVHQLASADGSQLVLAVRRQQDSMTLTRADVGEEVCMRAVYPFWLAQPYAFARAPWAPQRWLVGLDDDRDFAGPRPTVIGVLDEPSWRYLEEGLEVGDGPLLDMVADDSGHLWAARPWSGDLIRISAAPGVHD